jgi:hypothetical protein
MNGTEAWNRSSGSKLVNDLLGREALDERVKDDGNDVWTMSK